jgi:hypothetical protein
MKPVSLDIRTPKNSLKNENYRPICTKIPSEILANRIQKYIKTILWGYGPGGVTQVVESLTTKCKTLSSNPNTTPQKGLYMVTKWGLFKRCEACLYLKNQSGPGVVVHACNPGYLGGGHRRIKVEDQPGLKVRETLISKAKPSVVMLAYNLKYLGGRGRTIAI